MPNYNLPPSKRGGYGARAQAAFERAGKKRAFASATGINPNVYLSQRSAQKNAISNRSNGANGG